jgi:hypothetical protein
MQDLICKFVYLDGREIGESVDVHRDRLIVKVGGDFIAIPLDRVEKVEDEKIYLKQFDEKSAEKAGQEWFEEKSKPVSIEELKIFGFGEVEEVGKAEEEHKSRFSVVVKEIGEPGEEVGVLGDENDVPVDDEMNREISKKVSEMGGEQSKETSESSDDGKDVKDSEDGDIIDRL